MAGRRVQPQPASAPSQRVAATPPPRVATMSNNTTAPNVIQQMPLVHQRHTRNNNPFHLLANDNNNDDTVVASNCSLRSPRPNLQPIDLLSVLQAHQPAIQLASQPTSVRPSTPSNTPPPKVLLPPKIISITRNRVSFTAIIPGNRVPFPAKRSDSDSQNGKQSSVSRNRVLFPDSDAQNGKQSSVSGNRVPFPAIIPTIAPRILHNHLHDLRLHQPWTNRRLPPVTKHQPHYLPVVEPDEEAPIRLPTPPRRSIRLITSCTPCQISRQALFHLIDIRFNKAPANTIPQTLQRHHKQYTGPISKIEHYCNGVVYPVTKETITHYRKLIKDPLLKDLWTKAMSKELHQLAQGCHGVTKGTNYLVAIGEMGDEGHCSWENVDCRHVGG
jgi:hypothetical protein